jgi:hypothetical protein
MTLLSACGATSIASASPSPALTPSASPSAGASPSPSASASPLASPTPPAGFVCAAAGGGAAGTSEVGAVRIGQHPGYDRFVIEFAGGVPSYSVTPQSNATFTRSPKGDTVALEGTSGVLVVVHSVSNWTSYSGPTAFHPGYPFLREAQLVENFEGYQQWALGVNGTACLRVAVYSSPNRLVVDIAAI